MTKINTCPNGPLNRAPGPHGRPTRQ